ncbi:transposase [bacterium CG_4_9_14_3_um_filter_65_15]|nr:MAG: transposase [bacterium CG_4_9_14_3_um_filter_65_15]
MAHFHIKKKKGRPYLYVREIARVDGRPKVVSQVYLGSPEKVAALAQGPLQQDLQLKVEEFGALWLAQLMDQDMDLAGIIDEVVPQGPGETGPSVGEYFLYCVWNRMIEAVSKHRLARWYGRTAIQQIRPVALDQLSSERYWQKWDRVSEADLDRISRRFFARLWEVEQPEADCLLFDTTNYYTFMGGGTESDLAVRGHNKAGRHQLRQIGLALLVARQSRLPLFWRTYPSNIHDSRLFAEVMQEMFGMVTQLERTKQRLTVVVDKGMNSEENFLWLDDHPRMHFVTTYSPHYLEDLMTVPLDQFAPIEIPRNHRLAEAGEPDEQMLGLRTRGEFWGRERSVVVTWNPPTARKQHLMFTRKLDQVRDELLAMRAKVRQRQPQWRDPEAIWERYFRLCEQLHVGSDLYDLEFTEDGDAVVMGFRKNAYRVGRSEQRFDKTVIVTDNTDWTTAEIVTASLDRWQVEDRFRQSKDRDLVSGQPVRHWTDGKIRCHFFSCVAALAYLRRLELRLKAAGVTRTAAAVMEDMRHLHSVLMLPAWARKPRRRLETPSKTQEEVLRALGWRVDKGGVLQRADA